MEGKNAGKDGAGEGKDAKEADSSDMIVPEYSTNKVLVELPHFKDAEADMQSDEPLSNYDCSNLATSVSDEGTTVLGDLPGSAPPPLGSSELAQPHSHGLTAGAWYPKVMDELAEQKATLRLTQVLDTTYPT